MNVNHVYDGKQGLLTNEFLGVWMCPQILGHKASPCGTKFLFALIVLSTEPKATDQS